MPQENVEVVRAGVAGRDALDRLLVLAPALVGLFGRGSRQVPVGSSARRRLVSFGIERAFAAMARSDVEVVRLFYEPDAEVWMRSMAGVGVKECYRGHDGVRALYAEIDDAWARWSWTVRAVVDGGDRFAIRTDFVGYGRTSGARTVMTNGGTAALLSPRGLVTWQEWFVERDGWYEALQAVGLSKQNAHAES
jgi:SnoaL-like protein